MYSFFFLCSVVKCKNLTAFAFGQIEGRSMEYGSTLKFSCNTGYTLRGSRGRTCQANGIWSGEEALCDSKQFYAPYFLSSLPSSKLCISDCKWHMFELHLAIDFPLVQAWHSCIVLINSSELPNQGKSQIWWPFGS